MNICSVETEPREQKFFRAELAGHEIGFPAELSAVGPDAEVVSGFINSRMDGAFLEAHPKLRLIATRSVTWDHIDLEACNAHGVKACNVPNCGGHNVAEHTFALLLSVARRLAHAIRTDSKRFSYESLRGFELHGKTLGMIGTGRIGMQAARLGRSFGMEVIAFDIAPRQEEASRLGFTYVGLDEVFARSDVISLHATLTPASHHLLNRKSLAKCRRGVVIINTAHGRLIDTEALLEALDSEHVAGVGLDVLEEERVMRQQPSYIISDDIIRRMREGGSEEAHTLDVKRANELFDLVHNWELMSRPNVVVTPHIAFNSREAVERINRTTVQNIRAFVASQPIHVIGQA